MSAEPLLSVADLSKWFPVRKGLLIERTVDHVKAVDGVSFEIGRASCRERVSLTV